jgi:hypothetical protein
MTGESGVRSRDIALSRILLTWHVACILHPAA